MIPSAESSCILVQADTIFMLRESTTSTLHSNLPDAEQEFINKTKHFVYRTWLFVVVLDGVSNDIVHNT